MGVDHRLALVTGATSGIGEALARLLASKNVKLLLTGRNRKKLQQLKEDLSSQIEVDTCAVDLASPEGRRCLVEWMKDKKPDLIVNNAGFGLYGEAFHFSVDEQMAIIQVDVLAVVEITLQAVNMFIEAKREGTILNVSSAAGYQIFPNLTTYAASKAFVNAFSRSLDFEVKPKGIRVLLSCPGQVSTGFFSRASNRDVDNRSNALVMSATFAANALWRQIESGKAVEIFDWKYKIGNYLSRLIPTRWLAPILQRIISKRQPRSGFN